MRQRVVVSWSTGKDSAWCLHSLRLSGEVDVVGLITTVTPEFGRVSIHGTRRDVLQAQATGLGLPVWEVELPYPCSNEDYEAAMRRALSRMVERWAPSHVAFGDLFLEDVRAYREERMKQTPLEPLFPLWGRPTDELAREMLEVGLEAVLVSAPGDSPASAHVGKRWTSDLLDALPSTVDRCGENGEFHTCYVGGLGLSGLNYRTGDVVERDGSTYCDLMLEPSVTA